MCEREAYYFASIRNSLLRIIHNILFLNLADKSMVRGRTRGQSHPQGKPDDSDEAENVEDACLVIE
jgi:hypothetical protein